jgi:hypothetical protein
MKIGFWAKMQWVFLPLYWLGWRKPMGWASAKHCNAIAADAFRRYGEGGTG